MNSRLRLALKFTLLLLLISGSVSGHDGPPFPIIVDQKAGPCMISLWADPDVGTGTFFVLVNAPPGGAIPSDLKIDVGAQPASGRLAEAFYSAARENLSGQVQYKALVPLDAQESWRIRVHLQSAQGSGEAIAAVEATPPGLGRWDLLVYLLPFLAVGLLWFIAVVRKRSRPVAQG
ncbi:MAG TPA: hypothetical protein VGO68_02255 [Pyrinomonadaceae bacterium]|jgi:hypothetical protein|nr:hypothetical protein [Pyrinomonadaceae bacterium]